MLPVPYVVCAVTYVRDEFYQISYIHWPLKGHPFELKKMRSTTTKQVTCAKCCPRTHVASRNRRKFCYSCFDFADASAWCFLVLVLYIGIKLPGAKAGMSIMTLASSFNFLISSARFLIASASALAFRIAFSPGPTFRIYRRAASPHPSPARPD